MSKTSSKDDSLPSIGTSVRAAREALRMSQEAFAQVLQVSPRTIARWEADESAPRSAAHKAGLIAAFKMANLPQAARHFESEMTTLLSSHVMVGAVASPPSSISAIAGFQSIFARLRTSAASPPLPEDSSEPQEVLSDFTRRARVFQALTNVADRHEIDLAEFSALIAVFVDELQKRDLTLDDLLAVLASE